MKIYVSGSKIEFAKQIANLLFREGFDIVSNWHNSKSFKRSSEMNLDEKKNVSKTNLPLIDSCDVLVLIDDYEKVPGGKFFEAGYAFAKGKKVIIHGNPENMMMYNEDILQAIDWIELKPILKEMKLKMFQNS